MEVVAIMTTAMENEGVNIFLFHFSLALRLFFFQFLVCVCVFLIVFLLDFENFNYMRILVVKLNFFAYFMISVPQCIH